MSSVFDKDTFLNQSVQGKSETDFTPVPINEYKGCYIDDIDIKMIEDKETHEEEPMLNIHWAFTDEALKSMLGMEKVVVKDSVFLDLDENGSIAFGINKNVKLGRIRDAAGQNDPKKPWNLNMLRGAGPFTLKVDHRWAKNGDGPFAEIKRVARG